MDCVLCGSEVAEPVYCLDDECQRWPLCDKCDEETLRLWLVEHEAQRLIDILEV